MLPPPLAWMCGTPYFELRKTAFCEATERPVEGSLSQGECRAVRL